MYEYYFHSLSNIISTLFTFPLAFSMLQVPGSYSHKHIKCLQKMKMWPKECRILCFLEDINIKKILIPIDYLVHLSILFKMIYKQPIALFEFELIDWNTTSGNRNQFKQSPNSNYRNLNQCPIFYMLKKWFTYEKNTLLKLTEVEVSGLPSFAYIFRQEFE